MKRTTALSLALLISALALCSGCIGPNATRLPSSKSQARATNPSMADPLGPTGLSRDSKYYMANDPP